MRIFVKILITSLIASCTTQSQYYSPNVSPSDKISIRTCGNVSEHFRREVAPGVVIELRPYLALLRLDEDKSARFIDDRVTIVENGQRLDKTIYKITTGPVRDEEAGFYDVKKLEFEPLGQLRGIGRFRHIDMSWGEWSIWRGANDTFVLNFNDAYPPADTNIVIDLPAFYAGNTLVDIEPIEFFWKSQRTVPCVQ